MSRDSGVTFEHVRRACYTIMSKGDRPSRPAVQELLATAEYLGRRGSNAVVQSRINEFWESMSKTLQVTSRLVDGVPGPFVPILDKALGDMASVARQIASAELAEREAALDARNHEVEATIRQARESALASDQLRVRAEGELSAVQTRCNELRESLNDAERKVAEESSKAAALQRIIEEKDLELGQQFASLEKARQGMEFAGEQHRHEIHRLMSLVDTERQSSRKEIHRLSTLLDRAHGEASGLREDLGRQRAEFAALSVEKNVLAGSLEKAHSRIAEVEARLQSACAEVTTMRVRYEIAEQHRKEAQGITAIQATELGELRATLQRLDSDLIAAGAKSSA